MNSRERVRMAINHKEPDRVPVDIGGTFITGVHVDEYIKIAEYVGLDCELPKVYEQMLMLVRPDFLMLNFFGADVIQLENEEYSFGMKNKDWQIWKTNRGNRVLMPGSFKTATAEDGEIHIINKDGKVLAKMAPSGDYFDRPNYGIGMNLDFEIAHVDIEKFKKSLPIYNEEELRSLEKRAEFLYKNTELSVHGSFHRGKLGSSAGVAGHSFEEWMLIMKLEPDYAYELMHATAEIGLENLKVYLQAVGKYIDTILISTSDYGTQRAEMFSPSIYKKVHLQNYKMMNDYVHQNSDIKTFYHSCGCVRGFIPYFIEAGVDILNPVQTTAERMAPGELKAEFGDKLTFWGGGIDTQVTLPTGTPQQVRTKVKESVEIFKTGGGFVFTPIHNMQPDIPIENALAMLEAVKEFGSYS